MTTEVFWLFVALVFGGIVGSFLNVCIYRIPEGISVIFPASRCPLCETQIRWYQNIPVLSWVVLRGRCATCRAPISFRYPLVEALSGLLYVVILLEFGLSPVALVYALFASLLLVITFIDLDHQIIPNTLSLPGIVLGFMASFLIPWLSWLDSLLGIIAGGGSLWLVAFVYHALTKTEGMGMGDVKLLAMIGAFLGYKAILPVVLISSLVGALIGVVGMVVTGRGRKLAIPFGPFLSLGAIVVLLWGDQLVGWYLGMFRLP